MTAVAVLVAAGRSTRFGGAVPKQFLDLGGEPIAVRAARALAGAPGVDSVVVVVPPDALGGSQDRALRAVRGVHAVVAGGASRAASALAGVEAATDAAYVLVHDAARPFVQSSTITAVLKAARRHGAAVPVVAVHDTVKSDDGSGFVRETLERSALRLAQTPQAARRDWMLEALRNALADGAEVTDEAQALERAGRRVAIVDGDPRNVKITTAVDWDDARARLADRGDEMRIGHGYDVHRFGGARELILAGLPFPGEPGLEGHSDADVVLHAAMDALLGAAALPDIGHHFPPGDPRYAGADSGKLLEQVGDRLRELGWRVVNLDMTVVAERPRIAGRVDGMRASIAGRLGLELARVGLKATTHEGLGALGRGEGIACHAVALIRRNGVDR